MILLVAALLAVEPLDLEMTPQDKKRTGVYKLRDKEKASLQQWIDSRYEKRDTPLAEIAETTKPAISENFNSGKFIRLTDNSLWEIRSQDTPLTQGWISSADIFISPSGDSEYPYKLTNAITGSSVLAKKIDSLPIKK